MAISETLVQLVDIRDDIRQALIDKGIDMANVPLSQYAEKIAGIGDFPGYKLHFEDGQHQTIKGSINSVVTWDNSKVIPLVITGSVNGGWRENTWAHFDLYLNDINVGAVYDVRPMTSYSAGSVAIDMSINLLQYKTMEELKTINSIKFNRTNGAVTFGWYCSMWLEAL
jgi:hypothetical protein